METVFIAGSIAISRLDDRVKERISKAVKTGLAIAVGDADGADSSIQEYLFNLKAENVTVYCSGDNPRNNVGDWPVQHVYPDVAQGTRAYFTAKDVKMARAADYGLMIWDGKSTGTLNNVIELVKENKKSVVFINKMKKFITVSDVISLKDLIKFMSEAAREKAEHKIKLSSKVDDLTQQQFGLRL